MSDTEDLQTYYTLLDIEESATPGEGQFAARSPPLLARGEAEHLKAGTGLIRAVRKAYLKKAAECHPDKHPEDEGATERFQALGGESPRRGFLE